MSSITSTQDRELIELLKSYQLRIPDRVNLVELLGANENAHTRILTATLAYKRNGEMPFVQSFVERFVLNRDGQEPFEVRHPCVETQRRNIDALIWEQSKYAIVIENKINWAIDQNKQIESYVESTKGICGIDPYSQCYVIYLTDDGRKEVSEISLTDNAKRFLGYKKDDSPGRYIKLNYREDILPWLKEEALASCRYIEQTLMSMLLQYIDYLEHRFALGGHNEGVRFLETHLCGSEKDKYAQLIRWNDSCRSFSGRKDLPKETAESFASQVRNAMEQMVKRNYSLNRQSAFDSKASTIKKWAWENGFHPHKWRNCILFEFRMGPYGERIKFQIVHFSHCDTVKVQFFNNDFKDDGKHLTLSTFPNLVSLFRQNFPAVAETLGECEVAVLGTFISETQLMGALNGPVKDFLNAFYSEFRQRGLQPS